MIGDASANRSRLTLARTQILAFRRRVQALDERLPPGAGSLRHAAWAGLQDSMPRAALLSIHARVDGTRSNALDDPSLVQVWGPRYSAYVIAAQDVAPFTLGRLPEDQRGRRRAEEMARRVADFLDGREMRDRDLARGLDTGNAIRYASTTGTILIRWKGATAPTVRPVPPPSVAPFEARRALARRYLHLCAPTSGEACAEWAGVASRAARSAFEALAPELLPARTPIGDAWLLAQDEAALRAPAGSDAAVRLLPSGDTYFLLQGVDRELLVPDAGRRTLLWTSRVWPGAVLVAGEIVGTWRRAGAVLAIEHWRQFSRSERAAVEAEAATLPLRLSTPTVVRWAG